MTRRILVLGAPLLAALVAYACGGDAAGVGVVPGDASPDLDAADAAPDASAACTALATARCQKLDACTGGLYTHEHFGDLATCVTREARSCTAALAAADTSATPASFEGCAAAIPASACADLFGGTNIQACLAAPGARADGTACSFNAQCKSTWCSVAQGVACGTCAERPAGGAPCRIEADCGGRGLFCAKSNTCALPVAASGVCDDSHPCGVGLSCVGQRKAQAGTCVALAQTVGAACDTRRETGPACQGNRGLYCTNDGVCAADTLAAAGALCGKLLDGDAGADDAGDGGDAGIKGRPFTEAICVGGAACDPASAIRGTCAAPAADGAACDRENGPPCLAPARCVTGSDASTAGTCQLPGAATCK